MTTFSNFNKLTPTQKTQNEHAITKAFPPIIAESQVIKENWSKLEDYFSEHQHYLLAEDGELIGFINAIPFQFSKPLSELPEEGWDWMFRKGIYDYEQGVEPNYLGGLQVIVRSKFQGLGYSKQILKYAKAKLQSSSLLDLVIPIRPTKKHEFPDMSMTSYLTKKVKDQIYDPWVRTHVKSGAEIIKVCPRSMTMEGDVKFWESMLGRQIAKSGSYQLPGALSYIAVDVENDTGKYVEPNVWIRYNLGDGPQDRNE